jgi:hypothetical protein
LVYHFQISKLKWKSLITYQVHAVVLLRKITQRLSRIVILRIVLVVKDQVSGNLSLTAKKSFKIRSRNSKKDRLLIQGSNEDEKKERTKHNTENWATQTSLKTMGELKCSGRVNISCSPSGTRIYYVHCS